MFTLVTESCWPGNVYTGVSSFMVNPRPIPMVTESSWPGNVHTGVSSLVVTPPIPMVTESSWPGNVYTGVSSFMVTPHSPWLLSQADLEMFTQVWWFFDGNHHPLPPPTWLLSQADLEVLTQVFHSNPPPHTHTHHPLTPCSPCHCVPYRLTYTQTEIWVQFAAVYTFWVYPFILNRGTASTLFSCCPVI